MILILPTFGKDEVPGPNPGSSSNEKHSNLTVWVLFTALLQLLRTVRQFDETRLQHKTDTETDTTKKNEPDGVIPVRPFLSLLGRSWRHR